MKSSVIILVLLLTIVECRGDDATGATTNKPPNIVFFLVDDLGWRDVGCFGSTFYETPRIDKFASLSVRFTNAYAACHVCSPTRASILTGKYPARLHLTDWLKGRRDFDFQRLNMAQHVQHLPYEEKTLAEVLKGHDYRTAIFGKWHLGEDPSSPLAHGFDQRATLCPGGGPRGGYYGPFKVGKLKGKKGDYLTDRLTDEAVDFIKENKDRPFFLYFPHFAVHDPIQGRPDLVEKYRRKLAQMKRPTTPAFILEGNPDDKTPLSRKQLDTLIQQPSHAGFKVLPQNTVKIKQHQDNIKFAAMVEAVDESFGRVLDQLEALELSDNTIVVFFSDNGGMSGANLGNPRRVIPRGKLDVSFSTSNVPLRGAKGWLYEGGIRVPMIVKWPKHGKQGRTCDTPVISTDFFPSLLEMAGLPAMPNQHKDGVSFADAVRGKAFARDAIYWHFPHYSNHGMQSPGGAIRVGDYKLLEYFENHTVQLFNLKNDPGEQNDLAMTNRTKAKELLTMLQRWRRDVSAQMTTIKTN